MQRTASVVFIHPKTGKVGLQLRSDKVNEPNTWAGVGGYVEQGEHPIRTVYREIEEELGIDLRKQGVRLVSDSYPHSLYRMEVPVMFQPKLNWESADFAWKHPSEWRTYNNIHPELVDTLFNRVFGSESEARYINSPCWGYTEAEWLGIVKNYLREMNDRSDAMQSTYPSRFKATQLQKPNPTYVHNLECLGGKYRLGLDLLMQHTGVLQSSVWEKNANRFRLTTLKGIIEDTEKFNKYPDSEGLSEEDKVKYEQNKYYMARKQILNFVAWNQGRINEDNLEMYNLHHGGLHYGYPVITDRNAKDTQKLLVEKNLKLFEEISKSPIFKTALTSYLRGFLQDPKKETIGGTDTINAKSMDALIYYLLIGSPYSSGTQLVKDFVWEDNQDVIIVNRQMQDVALLTERTINNSFIYHHYYKLQKERAYSELAGLKKQKYLLNNTKIGTPYNPMIPDPATMYDKKLPRNTQEFYRAYNLDMCEYADPELYYKLLSVRTNFRGWKSLEILWADRKKLWQRTQPLQLCEGHNVITEESLDYTKPLVGLLTPMNVKADGLIYSGSGPIPDRIFKEIFTYQGTTMEDYFNIRWQLDERESGEEWSFGEENELVRRDMWGNPTYEGAETEEEKNWIRLQHMLENEALLENKQGKCEHPLGKGKGNCEEPVIVFSSADTPLWVDQTGVFTDGEFYCDEHCTTSTEVEGYGDVDFGEKVPIIYADEYAENYVKDYY